MNNQKTLNEFERYRLGYRLLGGRWLIVSDPYIPPTESDTFYSVGNGKVQLFCIRDNPNNYRLDIYLSGKIIIGQGSFSVNGEIDDINHPYRNLFIRDNSEIEVTNNLTISKGRSVIEGTLNLTQMSSFICSDSADVTCTETSVLNFPKDSFFFVNTNATVRIKGILNIDISIAESVLSNPNIIIEPTASVNVTGIDNMKSSSDLTEIFQVYKTKQLTPNSVNEVTSDDGKTIVQFKTNYFDPPNSFASDMICKSGDYHLGNFKLPFNGSLNKMFPNERTLSNLIIEEDAILWISADTYSYYYPQLYLGAYGERTNVPAKCTIYGGILADGKDASIILDQNAQLIIKEDAFISLSKGAKLKCSNSDKVTLIIEGTLQLDSVDQLEGFSKENIFIGELAKVEIKNPDSEVILKIPNGIKETKLYQLFDNQLDKIKFWVNEGSGIEIDQNFEVFYRDLKKWFGNYHLDGAIAGEHLKWNGGYIKFDQKVIPWINSHCDLFDLIKIFPSKGNDNKEKLQSIIDVLVRAGTGKISFIFEDDIGKRKIDLDLTIPVIKNVYRDYQNNDYVIECSYPNTLFLKNNLGQINGYKIADHSKLKKSLLSKNTSFSI